MIGLKIALGLLALAGAGTFALLLASEERERWADFKHRRGRQ